MARGKKRRHGGRRFTLPVAAVAGFLPLASDVYYAWRDQGGARGAVTWLKYDLLGIDGNGHFNAAGLSRGLFPIIGGFVIHGLASRLGINRALGRMGIPIIRI